MNIFKLIKPLIADGQIENAISILDKEIEKKPWQVSLLFEKFKLQAKHSDINDAEKTRLIISDRLSDTKIDRTLTDYLSTVRNNKPISDARTISSNRHGTWQDLSRIIGEQKKYRIVFVNDNGFLYGAGIAVKRQALSFLNAGHHVGCVCWNDEVNHDEVFRTAPYSFDSRWLGVKTLKHVSAQNGTPVASMTNTIVEEVLSFEPDLVVSGNFHASGWPLDVLTNLQNRGIPVVTYIHDCDWVTGGCAHGGYYNCELFLTGCTDYKCPKPVNAYPPKTEGQIDKNWKLRSYAFSSDNHPLPLAANSRWTKKIFKERFGQKSNIGLVHLGVDTNVYTPGDKAAARKAIGVPGDAFIVLAGSGFFSEPGKGSDFLLDVFEYYRNESNVFFISFGHPSETLNYPNLLQAGYINDENLMCKLYQASDVFVNPVLVEAFGQTMLEASSCGCPIVAFPVCGVPDVAKEGQNAIYADAGNSNQLIAAIEKIRSSKTLQKELSQGGRKLAETEFSLAIQYRNWEMFLRRTAYSRLGENIKANWETKRVYAAPCSPVSLVTKGSYGGLRRQGIKKQSTPESPLITIATVLFNDVEAFQETINTILEQDHPNLEWIVIDGGSNDGTTDLLRRYDDYIDLWISEPDNGIYDAMNKAARHANGKYLNFMNAGDMFCGSSAISRTFQEAPDNADVVFGHVYYRKADGTQELAEAKDFDKKWGNLVTGDFKSEPWLAGLPPHQSTFMNTELIRKLKFDTSIKVSADWDLVFRAKSIDAKFHLSDIAVAIYLDGGYSAQNAAQWIRDVWNIAKNHSDRTEEIEEYFSPILAQYEVENA